MSFYSLRFLAQNCSDLSSSSILGPLTSGIVWTILDNILMAVLGFWQKLVILRKSSSLTISELLTSELDLTSFNFCSAYSKILLFLAPIKLFLLLSNWMISSTNYRHSYDFYQARYSTQESNNWADFSRFLSYEQESCGIRGNLFAN